ncbi:hypothetical protein E2C01_101785 [Portunus trituberculatus]|uniref:Uncharacterized protein n=1 Tax=Portunus trituberculatus TaxID=210409 RepID=A0A5B7KKX9_PORTR|nr:hypothetical protein [Portunus trituberculatus]
MTVTLQRTISQTVTSIWPHNTCRLPPLWLRMGAGCLLPPAPPGLYYRPFLPCRHPCTHGAAI